MRNNLHLFYQLFFFVSEQNNNLKVWQLGYELNGKLIKVKPYITIKSNSIRGIDDNMKVYGWLKSAVQQFSYCISGLKFNLSAFRTYK